MPLKNIKKIILFQIVKSYRSVLNPLMGNICTARVHQTNQQENCLQQYLMPAFHFSQKTTAGLSHTKAQCIDSSARFWFSLPVPISHRMADRMGASAVAVAHVTHAPPSMFTTDDYLANYHPDAITLESLLTSSCKSWKWQKRLAIRQY